MPESFQLRSAMPASADELFAWHARPAAFFRLIPPWESVKVVAIEGPFGDGQRVTLRATVAGPVAKDWVAELFDVRPGRQFRDRELHGPFAEWTHTHTMTPTGDTTSHLDDSVTYRVPFGVLGRTFGGGLARSKLDAMFRYRHALTASDLARHGQFRDRPRLTVAITGSTGLIGNELAYFLQAGGHAVRRLVRKLDPAKPRLDGTTEVLWNPDEPLPPETLAGVDALVHLAGENVAEGRWDEAKKARIRASRVAPTGHLAEAVAAQQAAGKPVAFVSSSAIGIYGNRGDENLDERSAHGEGFFTEVCQAWEEATAPAERAGARVVLLRTGVVLTPRGGALDKQLAAFQTGGGAMLGDGKQWISWITVGDQIGAIHHALMTESLRGPVNCVAPKAVTNRDFGRTLADVLNRPYLLTLPAGVLRTLFGELADAALLASAKVLPTRLAESGFRFDHPELAGALKFVLGRG